jgi:hypothetical protein
MSSIAHLCDPNPIASLLSVDRLVTTGTTDDGPDAPTQIFTGDHGPDARPNESTRFDCQLIEGSELTAIRGGRP